jgi:hypothetical protein
VLKELVYTNYQMIQEGANEEEVGAMLFSLEYRDLIAKRVSEDKPMTRQMLTRYLKVLIDKRLIRNTNYGYCMDKYLLPVKKLTFNFKYEQDNEKLDGQLGNREELLDSQS